MNNYNELRALGAPKWFINHVQKTCQGGFFLPDLLRPLILVYGQEVAINERLNNKLVQQEQEIKAKNKRIASLVNEKLGWEATNHHKNAYINELKARIAFLEGRSAHHVQTEAPNVIRRWEKVPVAVPYQYKKTWKIGDKVCIKEGLEGTVHAMDFKAGVLHAVTIRVPGEPGVLTLHSLVQRAGALTHTDNVTEVKE